MTFLVCRHGGWLQVNDLGDATDRCHVCDSFRDELQEGISEEMRIQPPEKRDI
jgi:hypothetical protein